MLNFNIPVIIALILVSIIGFVALSFFLLKQSHNAADNTANISLRDWLNCFKQAIKNPMLLIVGLYLSYFLLIFVARFLPLAQHYDLVFDILDNLTKVILVLSLFWLIIRLTNAITNQLYTRALAINSPMGIVLFPLINNGLKATAALILCNILLPFLPIPERYLPLAEKAANLLLIVAVTWIVVQLVNASERYFLQRYGKQVKEDMASRKAYTQLTVFKKLVLCMVIALGIAAGLMTFEHVRQLGTTLLASAGLIAAIGAFAAQKTLSSLFAGLQIALTQPIKINDAVIVENEFGNIEEINLNYVVIKLWDLRRMIVPVNYFIEKPFQNWTRRSSDLIGVVMLYVDYSLPVAQLRTKFNEIVEATSLWDRNVKCLQVTDTKERTIELRLLMSAANAAQAFDLRCEVREKIIAYIQEQFPQCLPKMRLVD